MSLRTWAQLVGSPATTANEQFSGLGFEPKALFAFAVSNGLAGGGIGRCSGFTNTVERVVLGTFSAAETSPDTYTTFSENNLILIRNDSGNIILQASDVAFTSDGFIVDWVVTGASANDYGILYFALGGDDLEQTGVATFNTPTTLTSITPNLGFQPDAYLTLTPGGVNTTGSGSSNDANMNIGAADKYGEQFIVSGFVGDFGSTTTTRRRGNDNIVVHGYEQGSSSTPFIGTAFEGSHTSMTATGPSITFSGPSNTPYPVAVIGIKGPDIRIGSFSQPSTTGLQSITGLGFKPAGVMTFTAGTKGTSGTFNDQTMAIGVVDETLYTRIIYWTDRNALATPNPLGNLGAAIAIGFDSSLLPDATAGAESLDADGFTINWTAADADTAGSETFYIAFDANDITPVAATDATALGGTETADVGFAATDADSLGGAETSAVLLTALELSALDADALGGAETSNIHEGREINVIDSGGLGGVESASIEATLGGSDTGGLGVAETALVAFDALDDAGLGGAESSLVTLLLTALDDAGLGGAEFSAILVLVSAAAARTSARPTFTLSIGQPLTPAGEAVRIQTLDLPPMTAVRWQTQLPGGFGDANIGLTGREHDRVFAYLPMPVDAPLFGHLELFADGALVYEGRVVERDRPGGEIRGLVAAGYGFEATGDDWFASDDPSLVTSGVILREVLRATAPLLQIGEVTDSGVLHAFAEFDGMTPGQIIDQLLKEGSGQTLFDYAVYDKRLMMLTARLAPDEPDYAIPIDSTVQLRESVRDSYGAVSMAFDSGAQETPEIERARFALRHGFQRRKRLSGSSAGLIAATQFVETWASEHADPEISATVKRTNWRGLEMVGGDMQPPWLVRAGQWLQLGDYGPLVIERTDFDARSGNLSIELGRPLRGPLVERLQRMSDTDAAVRTGRNPVTGAKTT